MGSVDESRGLMTGLRGCWPMGVNSSVPVAGGAKLVCRESRLGGGGGIMTSAGALSSSVSGIVDSGVSAREKGTWASGHGEGLEGICDVSCCARNEDGCPGEVAAWVLSWVAPG